MTPSAEHVKAHYTGWRWAYTDKALHWVVEGRDALCGLWPVGANVPDPDDRHALCLTCCEALRRG